MVRPTKTQQVAINKRRAAAVRLRDEGKTWQQVADEMGYPSYQAAHNDVERARAAALADLNESVREIRDRELARLDMLYDAAVEVLLKRHVLVSGGKVVRDIEIVENENGDRVIAGDTEPLGDDGPTLQALDRVLRVEESRRKLLGLDAPQKIETSGSIHYTVEGVDPGTLT